MADLNQICDDEDHELFKLIDDVENVLDQQRKINENRLYNGI
jgi:hypothetical protein